MSEPQRPAISTELLLEHVQFVRGLSRHLLADEDAADEVEQQTWLAALENPPRRSDRVRSWLRSVSLNFARRRSRDHQRRRSREQAVARPESLPATGDLVARESALRSVVDTVLSLSAIQREVVLLRYYEDLPPREIAARLGLPVTTVQSRLQRAHEALRARLDERSGGDGTSWRLGLALLVGLRPARRVAQGALTGALLMRALFALLLLLGLRWTWTAMGGGAEDPPALPTSVATRGAAEPTVIERTSVAIVLDASVGTDPAPTGTAVALEEDGTVAVLVGRVLDPRRRPLAGVVVALLRPGRARRAVRSDPEGWFRHRIEDEDRGQEVGLHAVDDAGRAAIAAYVVPRRGGELTIGPMPLLPAERVVLTVYRGARPAAGAAVLLRAERYRTVDLNTPRNADVYLGAWTTGDDGAVVLPGLPPCRYVVRCHSDDGTTASDAFRVPGAATVARVIELVPATSIDVDVRDARTGAPIGGARITLAEVERRGIDRTAVAIDLAGRLPRTDEAGRATVRLAVPRERLTAAATATGYRPGTCAAGAGALEISLEPGRVVAWDVESEPPAEDAVLDVVAWPDEDLAPTASMQDGELVVSGLGPHARDLLVFADDGRVAELAVPRRDDFGEDAARFAPAAAATVLVREADGSPVAGLPIELRTEESRLRIERRGHTDSAGAAHFTDLGGGPLGVYVGSWSSLAHFPVKVARFDPVGRGADPVTVTLPARQTLRLDFDVEGERRLPPRYDLLVVGGVRGPIRERPDEGWLELDVWPRPEEEVVHVVIAPQGHTAVDLTIDPRSPSDEPHLVRLERLADLEIELAPPADGYHQVVLEQRAGGDGWIVVGQAVRRQRDARLIEYRDLRPARYRVLDRLTGIATEPFDVHARDGVVRVALDLAATRFVAVDLRLPDGEDDAAAAVLADGIGGNGPLRLPLARSGSRRFVRLPIDRSVRLTPVHPALVAHPVSCDVAVAPESDVVRLELVAARRASWEALRLRPTGREARGARVLLYDAENREVASLPLWFRGGRVGFADFAPGTYRVWADLPGRVPVDLPSVALGEGDADLGPLPTGPSGRLRVLLPEPLSADHDTWHVEAAARDAPLYRRAAVSRSGASELGLDLGPGRFRVSVRPAQLVFSSGRRERHVEIVRDRETVVDFR